MACAAAPRDQEDVSAAAGREQKEELGAAVDAAAEPLEPEAAVSREDKAAAARERYLARKRKVPG